MAPASTFGTLLRQARRTAGLTQKELAERAGIHGDTISLLERGLTRAPHPATLDLLAEALDVGPAERAEWERTAQGLRLPGSTPERLGGGGQVLAPLPMVGKGHLPTPATPLIGREQEVRAICTLLQRPEVRLLTVTGSAGVGKTRLALQAAANLVEVFAGRVHFVPLAALTDPALVLPTLAQGLGLRASGSLPILSLLTTVLREQRILLVLDNVEHVIAAAPHLAVLLEACPGMKLLVTSREVLHLRAEQQFVVPPLALPRFPPGAPLKPVDCITLEENPAVQLFLQRARAVQPVFQLTPDNAATIAAISHRLEGIPLAIELAAPRLKLLSPEALLARLEGRLQVLTGGARDLPERQRTMRNTIAWSYELLSAVEQALFRQLAVFVGGWTISAAEQVCLGAGVQDPDILEGLSSLLDKSLVSQEYNNTTRELRFNMLSVLREFGLGQLDAEGEGTTAHAAHAAYYLALVEEPTVDLNGAEPPVQRDLLKHEHDNLQAALNWWLDQAEAPEAAERAMRLWWARSPFWVAAYYREGYVDVKRVLALRAGVSETVQVKALLYAASVLLAVDEVEQAKALVQEALALAGQIGDLPCLSSVLPNLRAVQWFSLRVNAAQVND